MQKRLFHFLQSPTHFRHGHCVTVCTPDTITVVGGRENSLVESYQLKMTGVEEMSMKAKVAHNRLITQLNNLPLPEVIVFDRFGLAKLNRSSCAAFSGDGCLLLYGGSQNRCKKTASKAGKDFLFFRQASEFCAAF